MTKPRYVYLVIAKIGHGQSIIAAYFSEAQASRSRDYLEERDLRRPSRPGYASYVTEFEVKRLEVL